MAYKVLVVSDSHRNNQNLKRAIKNLEGYLDMMIHLGDSECNADDIRKLVDCPVKMVRGNCDGFSSLPGTDLVEFGQHKAMITHGHQFGGKMGIESMKEMAKENGADIVMFGHIHEPIVDESDDVVVLNPGSISLPRQPGFRPSYIVITIQDDGRTDYVDVYLD